MPDTPPLPENLAALIGSLDNPDPQPDYVSAWYELVGYVRQSATRGNQIDSTKLLDYLQEIHDGYHLPPERAPKRGTETTS